VRAVARINWHSGRRFFDQRSELDDIRVPIQTGSVQNSKSPSELGTGLAVRVACREGIWSGPTAGQAAGHVQANLVILPEVVASDFLRFCQRNPKPCPLLGVSEVGEPRIPMLGSDLDVRTDIPAYRVWQEGALVDECADVSTWWRADLVAFALGCSFSFEAALIEEGLEVRHVRQGTNVPMYRTSIECVPAGRFGGPMVVSMRPFVPADAIRAVQVTSRFPAVHGAPVHIAFPERIGIVDLARPDYGDAVEVRAGELPVFWACGVTPQAVIADSKVPFAITHAPGAMLVTDLRNRQLAAW
jgi:uncharacterized protein YcsI (UPF0317 family)